MDNTWMVKKEEVCDPHHRASSEFHFWSLDILEKSQNIITKIVFLPDHWQITFNEDFQ